MIHGQHITIVAAIDSAGGIGAGNALPWPKLHADMVRFKNLTVGGSVIMGRRTWGSLGTLGEHRALPQRQNIIVTRDKKLLAIPPTDEVEFVSSLSAAVCAARSDISIIGGGQLFKEALPYTDLIHLTRVRSHFPQCDTFFPVLDVGLTTQSGSDWRVATLSHVPANPKTPISLDFLTLMRVGGYKHLDRAVIQRHPSIFELQQDLSLPPAHYPNP